MTDAPAQPRAAQAPTPPPPDTSDAIGAWLDRLLRLTRLPRTEAGELRDELDAHLRERCRDLMLAGYEEPEAIHKSISELGDLALLAQRYREASRTPKRRLTMQIAIIAAATTALGLSTLALRQSQTQPDTQAGAAHAEGGNLRLRLVPKEVGPDGQGTYELAVTPEGEAVEGLFHLGLRPLEVDENGNGTYSLGVEPGDGGGAPILSDIPLLNRFVGAEPAPSAAIGQDVGEAPLAQVLDLLAGSQDLRPYIHWRDLQAEPDAVLADLPLEGQQLDRAFDMLNDALELDGEDSLTYRAEHGLFEVASRGYFDMRERELVTYDVGDLVTSDDSGQAAETPQALAELIWDMVEPEIWPEGGGTIGTIHTFGEKLFVNAPPRVHERIVWLLGQLRDQGDERASASEGRALTGFVTDAMGSAGAPASPSQPSTAGVLDAGAAAAPRDAQSVEVFALERLSASELQPVIAAAIAGFGGQAETDARSNSLLIVGDGRALAVARSIIGALDRAPAPEQPAQPTGTVTIQGAIPRPGVYLIPADHPFTLNRLLASAGGPGPEATRVVVRAPDGALSHVVDLTASRTPGEVDVPLAPDDMIFVAAD